MFNRDKYRKRVSIAATRRAFVSGLALALFTMTASLTWAADRTIIMKVDTTPPLLLERPFNALLIRILVCDVGASAVMYLNESGA
jgi:hypothetical protein